AVASGTAAAAGAAAAGKYWDTATAQWVTAAAKATPKGVPLGLIGRLTNSFASARGMATLPNLLKVGRVGGGIIGGLLPIGAQMGASYMAQRARASGHPGYANVWDAASGGIGTGSLYGTGVGALIGGLIGLPFGIPGILAGAGI
ncbi:MAG: hypothetical protein V4671_04680, partial [Armatimonadota bacterium]